MLWQCVCGVCVPIIKPWGLSIERWFRIHTPLAMRERGIKLLLKGRQNSWLCALEFVYFSAYDLNNAMYIWIYSYLQPVVHIYYNTCKGLVVLFISLYNESRTLDNFTLNQSDCYDCCSTYYAALLPRQRNFFFFSLLSERIIMSHRWWHSNNVNCPHLKDPWRGGEILPAGYHHCIFSQRCESSAAVSLDIPLLKDQLWTRIRLMLMWNDTKV